MMLAAKGHSYPDGTYEYVCGKCGGKGELLCSPCNWCFNGDFEAVRVTLRSGVRGQQYYSLLKEFLRIAGKALVTEARDLKSRVGSITPVEIGYLSWRFGLNLKATWEWLEECGVCAAGTYEDCIERGMKVKQIYEAAQKKYPVIESWTPA